MKKTVISLVLVAFLGFASTSCRETNNTEESVETIEQATEETLENENEGALEKIGKSVDNAVQETKEAGEAVEDAANDIDNDDN